MDIREFFDCNKDAKDFLKIMQNEGFEMITKDNKMPPTNENNVIVIKSKRNLQSPSHLPSEMTQPTFSDSFSSSKHSQCQHTLTREDLVKTPSCVDNNTIPSGSNIHESYVNNNNFDQTYKSFDPRLNKHPFYTDLLALLTEMYVNFDKCQSMFDHMRMSFVQNCTNLHNLIEITQLHCFSRNDSNFSISKNTIAAEIDKKENKRIETEKKRGVDKTRETQKERKMSQTKETRKEREVDKIKETVKEREVDKVKETEKEREVDKVKETEKEREVDKVKETEKEREVDKVKETEKEREVDKVKETEKEREVDKVKETEKEREVDKVKETEKEREVDKVKETEKEREVDKVKETEKESKIKLIKKADKEVPKTEVAKNEVKKRKKPDQEKDSDLPKTKRIKDELIFPPEYNEKDSRWTLRYQKNAPGLVELQRYTGVYVNESNLESCLRKSDNSTTLARSLLVEVFTDHALGMCSWTGASNMFDIKKTRPGLNEEARNVLLNYVYKCECVNDWKKVDQQIILKSIRIKMRDYKKKLKQCRLSGPNGV